MATPARAHRFVAIEGTDGSGKTSLRKFLFTRLRARGIDVVNILGRHWLEVEHAETITRGRYLREELPAAAVLAAFVADKEALSRSLIEPHLQYRHIVTDRYILSDVVYQHVFQQMPLAVGLDAYRNSSVRWPDVTVFVDSPPAAAAPRLASRPESRMQSWDKQEIQARFHELFSAACDGELGDLGRMVRLPNTGSLDEFLAAGEELLLPILGEAATR